MNKIWLMAATVCFLVAFGSCKPKQSAYKAAYEQLRTKRLQLLLLRMTLMRKKR